MISLKKQIPIKVRIPFLIFLLYLFISTVGINGSIYILDEAKNAECAREMLERGNLIVPTFNYELRTDKPPLHYFFMILSYKIFGVSPWSARLFSLIFGCLALFTTYFFTKKWLGIKIAWCTSLVLLSSLHYGVLFHMSVPDPYLIFFFTSSLFLFFECLQNNKWTYAIGMYFCLALGLLSKGPIAILLPGLIMLLYLLINRNLNIKTIIKLKPLLGLLIVLLIGLPWYFLVDRETNGEWTRGFFLEHNLERFSNTKEGHGGTFLMAPFFILFGLFPFSVFLPRATYQIIRRKEQNVVLFALTAGAIVTGFFMTSSTRMPNYTALSYPFVAIVLGAFIANFKKCKLAPELIALFMLSILIVTTGYFALHLENYLAQFKTQLVFLLTGVIGSSIALILYKRKNGKTIIPIIGYSFIIVSFGISNIVFNQIQKQNPVTMSIPIIDKNEPTAYFRKFNPSYPFYLKKKIDPLENIQNIREFLLKNSNACVISTKKSLQNVDYSDFAFIAFEQKDIFENRITVILKNKHVNK
ncbi:glycosyltransferase family 39 protein [Labilibaculum sp. A4]|uniref:ArnT family glycosyltransferase n=1 Tax=Labilibaculum euxinus TaxID=2686357 RepID=UPI000F623212|nr:glycosyltransferase family 39 protein [Labilibaculum euxinus]MDQ1769331.1 glycosyltransferase family 39 protein [Labilibaculum euxinus]MWN74856.1 glycosyltransferase family 39 protein [Labilibaculum euxinus]